MYMYVDKCLYVCYTCEGVEVHVATMFFNVLCIVTNTVLSLQLQLFAEMHSMVKE